MDQTEIAEVEQPPARPLSAKRQAFVAEYLRDLNGTQAAIRAGYPSASAGSIASEYLTIPEIKQAVEAGIASRAARVQVTTDQVLQEMSLLANSSLDHYFVDDEGQVRLAEGAPEGAMRAVQSVKRKVKVFPGKNGDPGHKEYDVEIKLWDKPAPLKLMGRHVGLFPDRVEVTGKDGTPLPVAAITVTVVDPAKGDK